MPPAVTEEPAVTDELTQRLPLEPIQAIEPTQTVEQAKIFQLEPIKVLLVVPATTYPLAEIFPEFVQI